VDGAPVTDPDAVGAALIEPLRALGRPVELVRASSFWKDASLRLEFGREDPDAYLDWLDAGALRREVLDAAVDGAYLPSLRDPATNRSTRAAPRAIADGTVLVVAGTFLLGLGLPFDVSVHLSLSRAARERRFPPDEAWTLPAFDRYEAEVSPADLADVVVRLDRPQHPAVLGL